MACDPRQMFPAKADPVRILHIGDIVGKPGRQMVQQSLSVLKRREQLSLVIANAENAAGGSGLTPDIYHELRRPESIA